MTQFLVSTFGATADGVTDDAAAIQAAIDATSATHGGEIVFDISGTYLVGTGLVVNKDNISLKGNGWGGAVLKCKTGAGITMLTLTNAAYCRIQGIHIDGNSKTAVAGLAFLPTAGGKNHYTSVRDCRIRQCQTGVVVGAVNDHSVVGISFVGCQVAGCNTGIQQQGLNTGDIFYRDGALTNNATVGFDMGSSQGAVFSGFSTNGVNGAADFRLGHTGNAFLTINDHVGNPTQGPFVLAESVYGQQVIPTVLLQNCVLSWNGTAGADIITYRGQGTVTIIGGSLNGDCVVRVSPAQALNLTGPRLVDMGLVLRGNPEPQFVTTGGFRHSGGVVSVNMG